MSDIHRFVSFPSFCGVASVPVDALEGAGADVVIIGAPEPGGLTSRELLDTVGRLARELPVVGAV